MLTTGRRAVVALVAVALLLSPALAQDASVFYVYDEIGRLTAVVDQQGDAATYTYDAVGNLLRIERFNTSEFPGPVGISFFTPTSGKAGTVVQIFGRGFGAVPGQNTVAFNGTAATVTAAAPNRLVASVPDGATTGPITVTSPLGTATSGSAFVVLGVLTVAPTAASLRVGATQLFEAAESGTTTGAVRWSVSDIPGGDAAIGTITAEGLFTAPATVPTPATVTVTATHSDDPALRASAVVTILPPIPAFVAAPGVSVAVASASPTLAAATVLSVAVASGPVVITAAGSPVAVAHEPVIIGIAPSSAPAGTLSLMFTLSGAGFEGATGLTLLRNHAPDPDITVTALTVEPGGTTATAEISIAAGAPAGGRVLQITTPGGVSTLASTVGNVFTVE